VNGNHCCYTAHIIIIITNIITTINKKMRQPLIIMLVGLMTLTGIVHLYRLNQGLWDYSSLSPQRGVTRSVVEVVVQHPTATTTSTAQASVQQTTTTTQQQPRNCTINGDSDNSITTTTTVPPEWLKIRGNQARWLHIGKAGGKK
jgi:hypothetical protein